MTTEITPSAQVDGGAKDASLRTIVNNIIAALPDVSVYGVGMAQAAPATCNATASMLIADLLGGIITSTSAAAVAASLPTGALSDAGLYGGTLPVATGTTGRFRTRKTAANTFVTYQIA